MTIRGGTMRRNTMCIAVGLLFAVVGCGADVPSKAGGQSAPLALTAVAVAGRGFPGGDQLADFARRVSGLSAGGITIDILEPSAAGERETGEALQAGEGGGRLGPPPGFR